MTKTSGPLLDAPHLRGRAYAEAHSDAADQWLRAIFHESLGDASGLVLAAVGGYGRRELSPYSDIDVVLVHDGTAPYTDAAEALWYPVWDRGMKLGSCVVNLAQATELVRDELFSATSLLTTRLIAGDHRLLTRLDDAVSQVWADSTEELLGRLADSVRERHDKHGDVAFLLEPNLKEGRGGLRDVHALEWANRVLPGFAGEFFNGLGEAVDMLLDARVELHRLSGRAGDVLALDTQDGLAAALGFTRGNGTGPNPGSGEELMLQLALAARRIAWRSNEAWSRWERATGRVTAQPRTSQPISTEFGFIDGELVLTDRVDVATDPLVLLRLAATAARTHRAISRPTLALLRDVGPPLPEPWPAEARKLFADIFLCGRVAIDLVEDLEQFDLMTRLIPEWEAVRCRPQRNVLHTFTVDRHLCEAAANASKLAHEVVRPDLLVVGTLFHDIGKGFDGDHTEVGMQVIATMAARMGYPDDEVAVLVDLCRHHLLLPDFATRRDLSDPGTISAVAAAVDSVEFLDMLAALTEADSLATGPSAWGSWKAGLLDELVHRTAFVLDGGAPAEAATAEFPTDEVRELMADGKRTLLGKGTTFTVVAPDQPALFSLMSGVLAVNGLEVLDASAHAGSDGMVACEFTLQPPSTGAGVDWDRVLATADRALDGRVALTARVHQRAQKYSRYQRRLSASPPRYDVVIDNAISDVATVVEVHAPDTVGLLFWITQALAELRLDIRSAKVQTFGPQAVDSFYVFDSSGASGGKVNDPELLHELDLAVRQAVGEVVAP